MSRSSTLGKSMVFLTYSEILEVSPKLSWLVLESSYTPFQSTASIWLLSRSCSMQGPLIRQCLGLKKQAEWGSLTRNSFRRKPPEKLKKSCSSTDTLTSKTLTGSVSTLREYSVASAQDSCLRRETSSSRCTKGVKVGLSPNSIS